MKRDLSYMRRIAAFEIVAGILLAGLAAYLMW